MIHQAYKNTGHRLQVLLKDIDLAMAARYFRLLTVIAYTAEGKVLTGLGEEYGCSPTPPRSQL